MSDYPTSMISPCQEGKSSPDALRRSARNKTLQVLSSRSCLSAVVPRILQPDIHLLSQPMGLPQKIEFVISCHSKHIKVGLAQSYAIMRTSLFSSVGN